MRLATLIEQFETDFLARHGATLLPTQRQALTAMKSCRTHASRHLQVACPACEHTDWVPHSCGHRACAHCQHHESEQWLARQRRRQLPVRYFMVTFTLPKALRRLAWVNQRIVYDRMIRCAWATLVQFTRNDPQLRGEAGAIAVLHTHSRRLDYHPHVHFVVPAGAVDAKARCWRTKRGGKKNTKPYLFSHKALAKVFRAKLVQALTDAGLTLPAQYPKTWVADCKAVGSGEKALVYLARYLYRGVIAERNIVACENANVTFRYRCSKTRTDQYRTLPAVDFLALVLRHVLPKGFRRARNFGFLHPNCKRLITLIQVLVPIYPAYTPPPDKPRPTLTCPCCGATMIIVRTGVSPHDIVRPPPKHPVHGSMSVM